MSIAVSFSVAEVSGDELGTAAYLKIGAGVTKVGAFDVNSPLEVDRFDEIFEDIFAMLRNDEEESFDGVELITGPYRDSLSFCFRACLRLQKKIRRPSRIRANTAAKTEPIMSVWFELSADLEPEVISSLGGAGEPEFKHEPVVSCPSVHSAEQSPSESAHTPPAELLLH